VLYSYQDSAVETTLTKALLLEIPAVERLIMLEDASELRLDGHPNAVRLFYSKDEQGLARLLGFDLPDLGEIDSQSVIRLNERMDWSRIKWLQ